MNFSEVKSEILHRAECAVACMDEYCRCVQAATEYDLLAVVCDNFIWCVRNEIIDEPLLQNLSIEARHAAGVYINEHVGLVKSRKVFLLGNSTAELSGYARAELSGNSTAELSGRAKAVLYGHASARLSGHARAVLYENASARLYKNTSARLYGHASARLYGRARAVLSENATARLYKNASAHVFDNASVRLSGNATVYNYINNAVTDFSNFSNENYPLYI